MSDTYDTVDTYEDDPEDSPVIRKLRAENRAKEKALKELQEWKDKVESAAQTRRAEAAKAAVNRLGLPGLADDVLNWVEGDITEDTVVEALKARSIPVPAGHEPVVESEPQDEPKIGSVSNVGQRVADAASGRDGRDLEQRIADAQSAEEVAELMAEAGLTRSHA